MYGKYQRCVTFGPDARSSSSEFMRLSLAMSQHVPMPVPMPGPSLSGTASITACMGLAHGDFAVHSGCCLRSKHLINAASLWQASSSGGKRRRVQPGRPSEPLPDVGAKKQDGTVPNALLTTSATRPAQHAAVHSLGTALLWPAYRGLL